MDDHEVLQHLLSIENEAAVLVSDAQTEADRRITEGEKQNRARYEEIYSSEIKILEASFAGNVSAIKDSYRKELEVYHESLKTMPINTDVFFPLAGSLLIPGKNQKCDV